MLNYINGCVGICWQMVMHSPPLCFDASGSKGGVFDKDTYRYYQTSGTKLNFIVWPAFQLHKAGPLLSKGVAEALGQEAVGQ